MIEPSNDIHVPATHAFLDSSLTLSTASLLRLKPAISVAMFHARSIPTCDRFHAPLHHYAFFVPDIEIF
jgi:hypothetical protein